MNLLTGLGIGESVYNVFSGERQRSDYLKQQRFQNNLSLRQQDHAENLAHNAVQIRRRDLELAGLHPTLAAGGAAATTQGHMPSNNAPPKPDSRMSIFEQALMQSTIEDRKAQIERTRADAARIRTETNLAIKEFDEIKKPTLAYQQQRVAIEGRQLSLNELNSTVTRAAQRAGIDKVKVETAVSELERRYMKIHDARMPFRNMSFNELENFLSRIFSQLGTSTSTFNRFMRWMSEGFQSRFGDPHPYVPPHIERQHFDRIRSGNLNSGR